MSSLVAGCRKIDCALAFFVFCVTGISVCQADPTVSLKAVKKNGVDIVPTSSITAVTGDVIECEIYVDGFSAVNEFVVRERILAPASSGISIPLP